MQDEFNFGVVFFVGMFLVIGLIILIRRAKYGTVLSSLKSTALGGIPIIDKDGNGDVGELMQWEQHPMTKKIRLRVNIPDKFTEFNTPFIFDPHDFYPTYRPGYWEHYIGAIRLLKDFEGREDYRSSMVLNLTEQNQKLKSVIHIYKRNIPSLLEYIEGTKIKDIKKDEIMDMTKMLKTMKTITDEVNVDNVTLTQESEMFE
ncbi:MAG: hypothetical protein AABY22_10355 [Nanoarchaeota archaeon]